MFNNNVAGSLENDWRSAGDPNRARGADGIRLHRHPEARGEANGVTASVL